MMFSELILSGAWIFQGAAGFVRGDLFVSGGRIEKVILSDAQGRAGGAEAGLTTPARTDGAEDGLTTPVRIDGDGMYVIPGLIDVHTHGNSGCDFSDGDVEGLIRMGRYSACHGITSFAPTSMTLPYERLEAAFRTAAEYAQNRPRDGARLAGIHMEGPFFSEKKKGAQNEEYLKRPDSRAFLRLQAGCGGLIRIVDVAPELDGAVEFIRDVVNQSMGAGTSARNFDVTPGGCQASESGAVWKGRQDSAPVCRVSVAHTDASYEEGARAFDAGATHLTHLFNAMPPVHHRNPGVIGAASERESVAAELICDGIHVHPSAVRMAFKLFPGRICLISDSLRCCGMPDGVYELGGQKVFLKDGQARLADGTLAGAARNLYEDMVNAIRFGIPVIDAVMAATLTPAREVGMDHEAGSLAAGKRADFLVCDEAWNLKQVYLDGRRIAGPPLAG